VGFPDIFYDEGVYMERAIHLLNGLGLQDGYFHDHPYFGQIFLASIFGLIGFPNSWHPSTDQNFIASLYLVPRLIMGLLAVLDTFLIYQIADTRYGKKIALVSSLLFAVMPFTWIVRRILLDSILLPFLLTSILFALKTKGSDNKYVLASLSGICLGVAIFTKIPVFAMIPLVAGLVYFNTGKNVKALVLLLIPVVLIPMMWPLQAVSMHQFDVWLRDVLGQTQRPSFGLPYISLVFFNLDPVLFILGIAGTMFAIMRRHYFILFWVIPFVIFLLMIGYNQYFYWIPILPVFCISASILVVNLLQRVNRKNPNKILPFVVILGIAMFGVISTFLVISVNVTNSEFQTTSFILQNVNDTDTTVLANPTYEWVLHYVFHKNNTPNDYSFVLFNHLKTGKILLVADPHFLIDLDRGKQLQQIYDNSTTISTFDEDLSKYDLSIYPYSNIKMNIDGAHIQVKMK
jgi:4-amino-4-deoxy-L-arabinose transferase-like glycosyltransferase